MKRISSPHIRLFALIFGASVLVLSPALASATSPAPASKETDFCTNLPATIAKVNSSISSLTAKLSAAQTARLQDLNADWAKVDQTLASDRATWAAERQTQFTNLAAKATTDSEKAAVSTFQTTITTAISTRESANDAARATYRTAVTALVSKQQATVNGQVTAFTNAVDAAESAATAGCLATPSSASVRTTFQAALKTARLAYSGDRNTDGTLASQVKALGATRDAAIKTNDTTFQNAVTAAENALKAAF